MKQKCCGSVFTLREWLLASHRGVASTTGFLNFPFFNNKGNLCKFKLEFIPKQSLADLHQLFYKLSELHVTPGPSCAAQAFVFSFNPLIPNRISRPRQLPRRFPPAHWLLVCYDFFFLLLRFILAKEPAHSLHPTPLVFDHFSLLHYSPLSAPTFPHIYIPRPCEISGDCGAFVRAESRCN